VNKEEAIRKQQARYTFEIELFTPTSLFFSILPILLLKDLKKYRNLLLRKMQVL
jgi:2-phospho-L-lactate transferase/gluconeogenesis factor (CofD/UPF0052 family)